jgi:hypothetical protein
MNSKTLGYVAALAALLSAISGQSEIVACFLAAVAAQLAILEDREPP